MNPSQKQILESVEGIGDILCHVTKRNRSESAEKWLTRFDEWICNILSLQVKNPDLFKSLVLEREFAKKLDSNDENALSPYAFYPEKIFITLSAALKQIVKVHEAALSVDNNDIARATMVSLWRILNSLASTENSETQIEQILRHNYTLLKKSLDAGNPSSYYGLDWFFNTVFPTLSTQSPFNVKYSHMFMRNFCSMLQLIVDHGERDHFLSMLDSLHHQIHIPTYDKAKIYSLNHWLRTSLSRDEHFNIYSKLSILAKNQDKVTTFKELSEWLDEFNSICAKIFENSESLDRDKFDELCTKIVNYSKKQFMYGLLLHVVFGLGAYCLYRKKTNYIQEMINFKQPKESKSTWIGHDIVPTTIQATLDAYFFKSFETPYHFRYEGHIDHSYYHREYLLLLLSRLVSHKNIKEYPDKSADLISIYRIPPGMTIDELSNIQHTASEISKSTDEIIKEILWTDMIRNRDEVTTRIKQLFDSITEEAGKAISKYEATTLPNKDKIKTFCDEIAQSYSNNSLVRKTFFSIGLIKIDLEKESNDKIFGILTLLDKAQFFDSWNVAYLDNGTRFGEGVAIGEDESIFLEILDRCDSHNITEFDDILKQTNNDDWFIVCYNRGSEYFENDNNLFLWDSDENDPRRIGYYVNDNIKLPVYSIYCTSTNIDAFAILNKNNMGIIEYMKPHSDDAKGTVYLDYLSIRLEMYQENEQMKERAIKEAPKWLTEIGDIEAQEDYLNKRALLAIGISFKLTNIDKPGHSFLVNTDIQ